MKKNQYFFKYAYMQSVVYNYSKKNVTFVIQTLFVDIKDKKKGFSFALQPFFRNFALLYNVYRQYIHQFYYTFKLF